MTNKEKAPSSPSTASSKPNPLIQRICGPNDTIPFEQIQPEDFLPALAHFKQVAEQNVQSIVANADPDFVSTIQALETSAEELNYVASVYYVLFSAHATEGIQKIAGEVSTFLAGFSSDITLNKELFEKVRAVHESKKGVENSEQQRLLDETYLDFVRNGASLQGADREALREIDQKLAALAPKFSEHLLKATNHFKLHITNREDLLGLPDMVMEQGAATAAAEGKEGWVFTLQYPDFMPFMTYAENAELRKKMYLAFRSRGMGEAAAAYGQPADTDNQPVVLEILRLREERARLLGFENHACYILEKRMARSPENVQSFLDRLVEVSLPAARKEQQELSDFAKELGYDSVQPYDIRFLAEKLKQKIHKFDSEELRPYFPLDRVMKGLFGTAEKLYGLSFKKLEGIEVYHPEVEVYSVSDSSGADVGLFYVDLFPRDTKKSGAWMTSFREQGLFRGEVRRPHIGIVCNFTRPGKDRPSLLSYDEVRTLFHEFGHALHGLLSRCTFSSLAGTNVYWDFVELPSQFMENWVRKKEGLDLFAAHYQTGEKIPADLVEKMQAAETFRAGWNFMTQLNYATLDMKFHTTPAAEIQDVEEFERKATERTNLVEDLPNTCFATGFGHIFAGGYSAGYYSYKWAEILEADAFELFEEKGLFDSDSASRFRGFILEKGNTEDPSVLYRNFRGRDPDPDALLRREGLLKSA
ncbi:MAG: M3 family metallopeptidase [Leptospiraceae bacterium]|nr:M3 family metallopeptidase [Leptospiraceae bacterium]